MELPKIPKPNGNMLSGLKSKLGFSGQEDEYRDNYADEGYDEYDDYADDYDNRYDSRGYDDGYDEAYDGRRAYSSRSFTPGPSSPNLVSFEDVRARTQIPDSLNRDPLPARNTSSAAYSSRPSYTAPARESVDAVSAARRSSEGLDSLFSSTSAASPAAPYDAADDFTFRPSAAQVGSAMGSAAASSYDPFDVYTGAGSSIHVPTRGLTVIKPVEYGEVERVAKALKAGDAAVLCLRNTPDQLAKRVLDFSFGVASYAEANVDCIADKVFVVVRGSKLTDAELLSLRSQGVL